MLAICEMVNLKILEAYFGNAEDLQSKCEVVFSRASKTCERHERKRV